MQQVKTILITGGTGGIGKQTALQLAGFPHHQIIITGRNKDLAEKAVSEIKVKSNNLNISYMIADMNDLDQVKSLGNEFISSESKLDILINNAGALYEDKRLSKQGYESMLTINHLSVVLLTHTLLPLLTQSSDGRIINISSMAHRFAKLDKNNWQDDAKKFISFPVYGQSKLINVMWSYAFSRMAKGAIGIYLADPGGAKTEMTDKMSSKMLPFTFKFFWPLMKRGVESTNFKEICSAVIFLSTSKIDKAPLYVAPGAKIVQSSKLSYHEGSQKHIWNKTNELLNLKWKF